MLPSGKKCHLRHAPESQDVYYCWKTLEYEEDRLSKTSCKTDETCEVETKWNGKLGHRRPTHIYNYTRYGFILVQYIVILRKNLALFLSLIQLRQVLLIPFRSVFDTRLWMFINL